VWELEQARSEIFVDESAFTRESLVDVRLSVTSQTHACAPMTTLRYPHFEPRKDAHWTSTSSVDARRRSGPIGQWARTFAARSRETRSERHDVTAKSVDRLMSGAESADRVARIAATAPKECWGTRCDGIFDLKMQS